MTERRGSNDLWGDDDWGVPPAEPGAPIPPATPPRRRNILIAAVVAVAIVAIPLTVLVAAPKHDLGRTGENDKARALRPDANATAGVGAAAQSSGNTRQTGPTATPAADGP